MYLFQAFFQNLITAQERYIDSIIADLMGNIYPWETIQAASLRQTKPISRGHAPAFPPTSMNLTESPRNCKKAVLADFCGVYGTLETTTPWTSININML